MEWDWEPHIDNLKIAGFEVLTVHFLWFLWNVRPQVLVQVAGRPQVQVCERPRKFKRCRSRRSFLRDLSQNLNHGEYGEYWRAATSGVNFSVISFQNAAEFERWFTMINPFESANMWRFNKGGDCKNYNDFQSDLTSTSLWWSLESWYTWHQPKLSQFRWSVEYCNLPRYGYP